MWKIVSSSLYILSLKCVWVKLYIWADFEGEMSGWDVDLVFITSWIIKINFSGSQWRVRKLFTLAQNPVHEEDNWEWSRKLRRKLVKCEIVKFQKMPARSNEVEKQNEIRTENASVGFWQLEFVLMLSVWFDPVDIRISQEL